jgi:AraC-like DNA-binding protein
MYGTPTYNSWAAMKQRCFYADNIGYDLYGGRGITVCDEWLTFEGFFNDMGIRPDGTTLDRIDSNGNYTPFNCRWADTDTQCNNRNNNFYISFNYEIKTATEWANELGDISADTIIKRINRGWLPEEALMLPIGTKNNNTKSEASIATQFKPTLIEHNGKCQSITEWANELGFSNPSVLSKRLRRGVSVSVALIPPTQKK